MKRYKIHLFGIALVLLTTALVFPVQEGRGDPLLFALATEAVGEILPPGPLVLDFHAENPLRPNPSIGPAVFTELAKGVLPQNRHLPAVRREYRAGRTDQLVDCDPEGGRCRLTEPIQGVVSFAGLRTEEGWTVVDLIISQVSELGTLAIRIAHVPLRKERGNWVVGEITWGRV